MNPIQSVLLGILQGATEFLPISSSGHLVVVPWLLHWPSPGLAFDTLVHWGTLVAVLAYFRDDLIAIGRDWIGSTLLRRPATENSRLVWLLVAGTVPAALLGLVAEDFVEGLLSAPAWVAVFLFVTAAALALSERFGRRGRPGGLALWEAVLIGLAQGMAIAPGISRSGATIAVAMLLGLGRTQAARFSFLLSIPIVFGAGLLQVTDLVGSSVGHAEWLSMGLGFLAAAVAGYLCIRFLLRYLQRGRLYPFAIYCTLLGLVVVFLTVWR